MQNYFHVYENNRLVESFLLIREVFKHLIQMFPDITVRIEEIDWRDSKTVIRSYEIRNEGEK